MCVLRTCVRCLLVFLTKSLLILTKADAQSLEISTGECNRTIGNPLEIIGRYTSPPGAFLNWQRPDLTTIGTCQPNVPCITQSGYTIVQSNSGQDYTLLITAATSADEGLWQLNDGNVLLTTTLTYTVNFSAVDVDCVAINSSSGYTESVTCSTECTEDALNISYNVNNLPTPITTNNSTGCTNGARYSSTITFDSNLQSGILELCYTLSSGNCNDTRNDDCLPVSIKPTTSPIFSTTTATEKSETTTNSDPTNSVTEPIFPTPGPGPCVPGPCGPDPRVPDECVIANLVLSGTILLVCGGLSFCAYKKSTDQCNHRVIAIALPALLAVASLVDFVLLILSLVIKENSEMRSASVILSTIIFVPFIADGIYILYMKCVYKCQTNRSAVSASKSGKHDNNQIPMNS